MSLQITMSSPPGVSDVWDVRAGTAMCRCLSALSPRNAEHVTSCLRVRGVARFICRLVSPHVLFCSGSEMDEVT